MVLLRRVIGDALREQRRAQRRTLREVSTAANVSLGYLSELERGQKEASSELLGAVCDALGVRMSDVLREVSDTLALAEDMQRVLERVPAGSGAPGPADEPPVTAGSSSAGSSSAPAARPASEPTTREPEPVSARAAARVSVPTAVSATPRKLITRATMSLPGTRPGHTPRDRKPVCVG